LELDAVFPVDAVFSHCRFVWLSQMNVPVVFLDPGINRTASLPNVSFHLSILVHHGPPWGMNSMLDTGCSSEI
jgi:hypothetical protein